MLKKSIIGIVVIAVLGVLIVVGIQKYIQSITTVEYGYVPEEQIPKVYEKVTYTIPTIDEEGEASKQTFTIENEEITDTTVKLAVRNDKVRKHEFIGKKDVPKHVKNKLPQTIF